MQSVPVDAVEQTLEIATKGKYGVATHSRFAGQELDLICNHKFV